MPYVKQYVRKLNRHKRLNWVATDKRREGLMESLNDTEYVGETEKAEHRNSNSKQYSKTLYIECAHRAHLYKSIRIVRSIDTYFNSHQ